MVQKLLILTVHLFCLFIKSKNKNSNPKWFSEFSHVFHFFFSRIISLPRSKNEGQVRPNRSSRPAVGQFTVCLQKKTKTVSWMTEGLSIRSYDGLRRTEEHCGKCSEKKKIEGGKGAVKGHLLSGSAKKNQTAFPFRGVGLCVFKTRVLKTWVQKQITLSASTNVEIQAERCSLVVEKKKLIMSFVKLNNLRVVL